ncbi:MAG TPA: ATP-binding protein [Acidimicrobiales bacterium]|nr:ATP-binding protein [Acidimicrobiales bacterium]
MPRNTHRNGVPADIFLERFKALVSALPSSRKHFAGWMRDADVDSDVADDLEVVFSELTANAVAGSPAESDDIEVRAQIDDGMMVLDVSNLVEDPDRRPHTATDIGDPLRRGGRGLLITRSFMDSVEVQTEQMDRLVVHCSRRVAPAR